MSVTTVSAGIASRPESVQGARGPVQHCSDGGGHEGMDGTSPLKCMCRSLDSLRVLDCSSATGPSSAAAAAAAAAGGPEGGLDPGKAL